MGDEPARGRSLRVLAEPAALLELVVVAPAEGVAHRRASQQPRDAGAGVLLGEPGQSDEHALRRRALAGDRDVLAGVGRCHRGVAEVGDAVRDVVGVLGLAQGGVAVGAQRVGSGPGARSVHDGAAEQPLGSVRGVDVDGEGVARASRVDHQVASGAADADDAGAVADLPARGGVQEVGEGLEVVASPLAAGGVGALVGCGPGSGGLEQTSGRRVDELGPRGEQAHVRPLADGRSRVDAGLEHDEVHAALGCVGGGGQPDGTCSDDDDRVGHGVLLDSDR